MECVATNPGVSNSLTVERVKRAYTTIGSQIALAIDNFYDTSAPQTDVTTGDPVFGAFSNLDVNFSGHSQMTCVGGCYNLNNLPPGVTPTARYLFGSNDGAMTFAQLPTYISPTEVGIAYEMHIQQQVMLYVPAESSVIQPILRREFDRNTGALVGYIWASRVYQRSDNMSHFPRIP